MDIQLIKNPTVVCLDSDAYLEGATYMAQAQELHKHPIMATDFVGPGQFAAKTQPSLPVEAIDAPKPSDTDNTDDDIVMKF